MRRTLPAVLRSQSASGVAERNADPATGFAALLSHIGASHLSIYGMVHKLVSGLTKRLSAR